MVRTRRTARSIEDAATTAQSRRLRFFDLRITPRTAEQTVQEIGAAIRDRRTLVIGNVNLHGLYMWETDAAFRKYTESADLCLIDGWPVLRLVEGRSLPGMYRIGSTDWLDILLRAGKHKVVAIAGTPESSRVAEERIRKEFAIDWTGIPGFELETRRKEVADAVESADVVLVGLGMPKQEEWILDNRALLAGKVVANVGGCVDYYSGAQHLAPRWTGPMGIEWLYRLIRDPRRMASRYLVEPLMLARLVLRRTRSARRQAGRYA